MSFQRSEQTSADFGSTENFSKYFFMFSLDFLHILGSALKLD